MIYGPDGRTEARRYSAVVRLPKKSLTNPSEENGAISRAVQAMRGIGETLPVLFGGDIVGWVRGRQQRPEVTFIRRPAGMHLVGYSKYDDIINACTAGRRLPAFWTKTHTTAPVANNWNDLWPVAGNPAAGGTGGAASTSVSNLDTTAGAIPTGGNVEPTFQKYILSVVGLASAGTPTLMLYDRVGEYDANVFNASANKTCTNTVPFVRYMSAGQSAMRIVIAVQTVTGATAANLTQLRYTNQAGTTLQTMPTGTTVTFIPSAAAPTTTLGARVICPSTSGATLPWGPFIPLAVGDTGARLVNDFTTSAANTGTWTIVMARPLFMIPMGTAGLPSMIDGIMQIANLERVIDGACLSFMCYFPAATAATLGGEIDVGWN